MIGDYKAVIAELVQALSPATHGLAVKIASLALDIKGYGHIKHRNYEKAMADQVKLLAQFRAAASAPAQKVAAE